ncbi:unnamed protein product, partial [Mesorhabditis spiculigera]
MDDDAVYVYKAYYDLRDPAGPRIRVLLTSNCSTLASNQTVLDLRIEGKSIGIGWEKMTNGVERSPSKYTDDVSACIGALHWFNDWPRLILYVEMARLNGISRILVTWQSISKEVKAVIDYYQQRGIIQPHPWPLLPFNEKRNPNSNVYIASHNLFTQHCNFWSSSKYTFLSDVDELLYMRYHNKTLFELLESWYRKKKDIAGFKFKHTPLALKMASNPFEYEKFLELEPLRKPLTYEGWRFPKSIFLTEYTQISWVHYPREFFAKKKNYEIPADEALYFHLRENFEDANATVLYPDVQLFRQEEVDQRIWLIADTIRDIFQDTVPKYRTRELYAAMGECRKRKGKKCEDASVGCWDALSGMDDWIYAAPTPNSYYIPV